MPNFQTVPADLVAWVNNASRENLIRLEVANDPDGCYTDEAVALEFDETPADNHIDRHRVTVLEWCAEEPEGMRDLIRSTFGGGI